MCRDGRRSWRNKRGRVKKGKRYKFLDGYSMRVCFLGWRRSLEGISIWVVGVVEVFFKVGLGYF